MLIRTLLGLSLLTCSVASLACSNDTPVSDTPEPTRTKIAAPVKDPQVTTGPGATAAAGADTPHIVALDINPKMATARDEIHVEVSVSDGAFADVQWYVNDKPLTGRVSTTLPVGSYKKGDRVEAEVSARKGGATSAKMKTAAVVIQNLPPEFVSTPTGSLNGYQAVATDPDGDELKWSIQGAPEGATLSETGKLSWPGPYKPGHYEIKIVATDPDGWAVTQIIPADVPDAGTPQPKKAATNQ